MLNHNYPKMTMEKFENVPIFNGNKSNIERNITYFK